MFDWTDAAKNTLKDMRGKFSSSEIGKLLGCSRNAVIGQATRMGLERLTAGFRTDIAPKQRRVKSEKVFRLNRVRLSPSIPEAIPMLKQPLNVPLVELEEHHCREVTGMGDDLLATYCGHPKSGETGYCIHHRRVNLVVAIERPKRPFFRQFGRAA